MKELKDELLFKLIRDFLTVYLPRQRACSPHTVKAYRESLSLLLEFVQATQGISLFEVSFTHIDTTAIREFMDWLETGRHCSASTTNHRLACIRSFFNYAAKMEISLVEQQNEVRKVPAKKVAKTAVEFLSEPALKALLEEPGTASPKRMRDTFYMVLLYDSGARNQEILNLRLMDIDLSPKHRCIHVMGKGRRPRVVPIMEKTAAHCAKYLDAFHAGQPNPEQFLFYTVRQGQKHQMSDDNTARFLKKYGKSAKRKCADVPGNIHPHLFRHTRAMHLYRGGMPLVLVSEWLGHAQLESTLIYAHADTEMKRKAIEKATASSNPIHIERAIELPWKEDEETLRRLYGLA